MGIEGVIVIGIGMLAVGTVMYGVLFQKKSKFIAAISGALAILASGLGYYAWTESQSIPWTIGYSIAAVLFLLVIAFQYLRAEIDSPNHPNPPSQG